MRRNGVQSLTGKGHAASCSFILLLHDLFSFAASGEGEEDTIGVGVGWQKDEWQDVLLLILLLK